MSAKPAGPGRIWRDQLGHDVLAVAACSIIRRMPPNLALARRSRWLLRPFFWLQLHHGDSIPVAGVRTQRLQPWTRRRPGTVRDLGTDVIHVAAAERCD